MSKDNKGTVKVTKFGKDANLFTLKSETGEYLGKLFISPDYNFKFDAKTGEFARWGKTLNDDPGFSPYGSEIADIEIGTACHGLGVPCEHCYKSNTPIGENMSLDTFKKIFSKFPPILTQIAFGIGDIDGNPDLFPIMQHCRDNDVIPNITINGYRLTKELAEKLAKMCGAIAVSRYANKDYCYNAVKMLADAGLKQVNIHKLVAEEEFDACMETMIDAKTDERLKGLNAIVFLLLKPKGKRNKLTKISSEKYKAIMDYALTNNINIGCDSCSAPRFLEATKDSPDFERFKTYVEPCESTEFSIYLNTKGETVPCSFLEDVEGYKPLDVLNCDNFLKDIWFHEETVKFRNTLLDTANKNSFKCRSCPHFDIY